MSKLSNAAPVAPLADLMPVFVPASFFALGNWPGPHEILAADGIGLTWAVLQHEQTMTYVNLDLAQAWTGSGVDWRRRALENLVEMSRARPWTHEFRRDSGEAFAVAMMHEDGLGPSRLLLTEALQHRFPTGYRVALPEMSCGVASSLELTADERAKIDELIDRCFSKGTRPLSSGRFDPSELRAKAES